MIRKIRSITNVTILEIARSNIFYSVIAAWCLCLLIATAFGTVSIGPRIYVIKDFGFFLNSISAVIVGVICTSTMISKDINRKHIHTILSKSISRHEYLIGKLIGINLAINMLEVILHILLIVFLYFTENIFQPEIFINYIYITLETFLLTSLLILISTIMITPSVVALVGFGLFIIGRNLESILPLLPSDHSILSIIIHIIYRMMPKLYYFMIGNSLSYDIYPTLNYTLYSIAYSAFYSVVVISLACVRFSKRDFN